MKNKTLFSIIVLLLLVSPVAYAAVVWGPDPFWQPSGTSKTVTRGSSATFESGDFFSGTGSARYKVVLKRDDAPSQSVEIVNKIVYFTSYMGYEITAISAAKYNSIWCGEVDCDYDVFITVSDSSSSSNTLTKQLTLTVHDPDAVNNAPVLSNIPDKTGYENQNLQFTVSASDVDGDTMAFSALNLPSGATFNAVSKIFSWTPTYDQSGPYQVTFVVEDEHEATDSQVVDITIINVNRAPVLAHIGDKTVAEGQVLTFSVLATDADEDALAYSAAGLPAGATFNAISRTFTWTPDYSQADTYDVIFTVTDGNGGSDSEIITITVTNTNRPPVLAPIGSKAVDEGDLLQFTISATDLDSDPLTFSAAGLPAGAIFNTATRTFSWVPAYDQAGVYYVNFTVTDGNGGTDFEMVEITVGSSCQDIYLPDIGPFAVDEGQLLSFIVPETDEDISVGLLTYSASGLPPGASFNAATRAFSWTPSYSQAGAYDITFRATLSVECYEEIIVHVVVNDAFYNSCPILTPLSDMSVLVGETAAFIVSATDVDGDVVSYSADAPFSGFVNPTTGAFSWTPSMSQLGNHVVTFHASDGVCAVDTSMNIAVTLVPNEAPDAQFNWTPENPSVGGDVSFNSTSTDPDGDSLICSWTIEGYAYTYNTCDFTHVFTSPGDYDVTLTVSDGTLTDSVMHTVHVSGQLTVTNVSCFSPVIEDSLQSCRVEVEGDNGVVVSGVNVVLHFINGTSIQSCVTDSITGNCVVTFASGEPGEYTVYATAVKTGWTSDSDSLPTASYTVLTKKYDISNFGVFNDSGFSQMDTDFFRGEYMYVSFMVVDSATYQPADDMVTSVALVSPPGGMVNFDVFPHTHVDGTYYYDVRIPTTHDFLGDSQVFTFAFNFSDGSGAEYVAQVIIRNNLPVIDEAVLGEFDRIFNTTVSIDLTPYESDVEDSGSALDWSVSGVDESVALVTVDSDDVLTVVPVSAAQDYVTLTLTDLDGDFDTIDVPIRTTGFVEQPECDDGFDNDGDDLVDMDDPDCASPSDDDESADVETPACSDGLDNDSDGLVDLADPGCENVADDDEYNAVTSYACSDGVDNDGDGLIDLADPGCEDALDNNETDAVMPPECSDDVDDDGDGLVDMADPGCSSVGDDDETDPVEQPACNDDFDNDGDGLIDMADPGCDNPADGNEIDSVNPQCSDGLDNDGDGLVDLADPDCSGSDDDNEQHVTACANGVDDDGDGAIDLSDPGCSDGADDDETDFGGNQPPIADIDLSREFGAPNMTIVVDGSGSYDPDGSIVSYSWHITGPGGYNYTGSLTSFSMMFYEIGTYTLTLTVTDDGGISDSAVATVQIGYGFAQCNDGIDNDKDGFVDWPADPHCFSQDYNRESAVKSAQKVFRDQDDLLITRINMNGADVEAALAEPGSQADIAVYVENSLDYDLDDVKLQVSVDELTLRETDKIGTLDAGDNTAARVVLDIPYDIEPGLYDMRIVVSNDDIRRVKYRQLLIV